MKIELIGKIDKIGADMLKEQPIDEPKTDIDLAVEDATNYLCSRGDTMHLRDEVAAEARRILNGLTLKGWTLTRPQ